MAYRIAQWVAVVVACCLVIAVAYRPSITWRPPLTTATPPPGINAARLNAASVAREVRELRERLEVHTIRDSMVAWLGQVSVNEGPQVYAAAGAEAFGDLLQGALYDEWSRLGRPVNLPVGVFVRTAPTISRGPLAPLPAIGVTVQTIQPETTDPPACLRIVTVPDDHNLLRTTTAQNVEYLAVTWGVDLGTCGVYAVFGVPGPTVDEWLDRTRHRVATSIINRTWASTLGDDLESRVGNRGRSLDRYSVRAVACAANKRDACRAVLYGEPDDEFPGRSVREPSGGIIRTGRGDRGYNRRAAFGWDFGGAEAYLVGDVFREVGPEVFQRFWTTTRPFEEAFTEMVNEDPGVWMSTWAQRQIGPVGAGPIPDGGAVTFLLGVTALALGAGVGAHVRRR